MGLRLLEDLRALYRVIHDDVDALPGSGNPDPRAEHAYQFRKLVAAITLPFASKATADISWAVAVGTLTAQQMTSSGCALQRAEPVVTPSAGWAITTRAAGPTYSPNAICVLPGPSIRS